MYSRRRFLALVPIQTAASMLALVNWPASTRGYPKTQAHPFGVIGKIYLAEHPRLRPSLENAFPPGTAFRALGEKIKRDYAESRTVILNGWVLSVTECEYCAHKYLTG
jgi:hypothetical protein